MLGTRFSQHSRTLLFILLGFCTTQCRGRAVPSDVDVTGGGQAVESSHWLAKSVVFLGSNCSGVIISPFHILTAGHRILDGVDTVYFGPDRTTALKRPKNTFVTHPEYKVATASHTAMPWITAAFTRFSP